MASQPITPPEIAGLMIRAYYPLVSLNKALLVYINPYCISWDAYVRGGLVD